MNTEEMIKVLRAASEGKDIERIAHNRSSSWKPHSKDEGLNYRDYVYRIVKVPEIIKVTLWRHRTHGNVISTTDPKWLPFAAGSWEILKTVTVEV